MNTLSKRDKTLKEIFIGNCWKYLHDNFHKFNDSNKIKIALALAQKDMPTSVEGMDMRQIVVMGEVKKGEKPLNFEVGKRINALEEQRETARMEEEE